MRAAIPARRFQRGSLTLDKSRPRRWILRYRADTIGEDGTIRRFQRRQVIGTKVEYPTAQSARLAADAFIVRHGGAPSGVSTIISAKAWCDAFLAEHLDPQSMAAQTIATYRSVIKGYIRPFFERRALHEIGNAEVQDWLRVLQTCGCSAASRSTYLGVLARVLRTARDRGFATGRFVRGEIEIRPDVKRARPRIGPGELWRIVEAARPEFRPLFATLGLAGLRIGEALGIQWGDLYQGPQPLLLLRRQFIRGKEYPLKTRDSERPIPVSTLLAAELERHRVRLLGLLEVDGEAPPAAYWMFANPRTHQPFSTAQAYRELQRILKALALPKAGLHAFRRGFATEATRHNVMAAKELMRHANVATTQGYVDRVNEDMVRTAEEVARAVRPHRDEPAGS